MISLILSDTRASQTQPKQDPNLIILKEQRLVSLFFCPLRSIVHYSHEDPEKGTWEHHHP